MANSTRVEAKQKPAKPRPDFPLFPHATGRWAKKVRGKFFYFGKWSDDPKGDAALDLWMEQKDDLLAGRTPRGNREGLTLKELVNKFLAAKEAQRDAGDITRRSYDDYYRTCERLLLEFGSKRLVDDLAVGDFVALRKSLAEQYGVHRLGNEVQRTRVLFKYGYDAGLIDKPVRYGQTFKRPAKRVMRAHRLANGKRMFDASEIRTLLDAAEQPLRAMILLGVNCGFGNHDCGTLPLSALDLKAGWVTHPRPKTAIERRCPLWPETVTALNEAIKHRPNPKVAADGQLVFLTKYGQPWSKETTDNPVSKEFRKLVDSIDAESAKQAKKSRKNPPAKLHRPGLGFYTLRHTFETIGGDSRDQVTTSYIMGHADESMAAIYRERISDERLLAVTTHVHSWLFPRPTMG